MTPRTAVRYAQELAAYDRHRADLEREHRGQIALLHANELVGLFPTLAKAVAAVLERDGELAGVFKEEQEALAEGARRFGLGKFLLMEVGDPVYSFPNCVLPGTARR